MEKKLASLVLSALVPGLGQIYNGQFWKGIAVMVLMFISLCLCIVLIGVITTPVLYVANIYDAMVNAKEGQA